MQVWESQRHRRRRGTSSTHQNRCHLPGQGAESSALISTCLPARSHGCNAEYGDRGDELQSRGIQAISFTNSLFIFPLLSASNSQLLITSLQLHNTSPLFLVSELGGLQAALLPLLVFTIWEISSLKIRCRSDVKK